MLKPERDLIGKKLSGAESKAKRRYSEVFLYKLDINAAASIKHRHLYLTPQNSVKRRNKGTPGTCKAGVR